MRFHNNLVLIFILTFSFVCQAVCTEFTQSESECEALDHWESVLLSDSHKLDNQDKFNFIFHSITGYNTGDLNGWTYKLLKNPSLLKGNPKISASLLSETKHRTFIGYIGFIISAPIDNIVGMGPRDLGSFYRDHDLMIALSKFSDWNILTPEQLLQKTPYGRINEIVILGTHPQKNTSIEIQAVMIACDFKRPKKLNDLPADVFYATVEKCKAGKIRGVIEHLYSLSKTMPVYGFDIF